MSDSVWPHIWQPMRLSRPWDSPGKITGVSCHLLLQCMKVKSESEVAQSSPTLLNPMDCSLPASSVHGIFQARVLEWGAIAFSEITAKMIYLLLWSFPLTLSCNFIEELLFWGTIIDSGHRESRWWESFRNSFTGLSLRGVWVPWTERNIFKPRQTPASARSYQLISVIVGTGG